MPRLNDDTLEQHNTTGSYGFSAAKIDDLGASEYTLVGIAMDDSGSVSPYARDIEAAIKQIVQACSFSPRADNLMLRSLSFGDTVQEINGFKLLETINQDDFDGVLNCNSMTALYDGTENIVQSVTEYARTLTENDFDVNAIIFVITDGMENRSMATVNSVKKAFEDAIRTEAMESIVSVLIGVDADAGLDKYLQNFKNDVGFTQYVSMGQATAKNLAKLAEFISKSISSQSQALGSGGPSQAIVSGSLSF